MGLLSKQDILDADDLAHRDVPCPEWGGDVRVRALGAGERDRFEFLMALAAKNPGEGRQVRAELVALAAVDGDGKRLFTAGDVAKLGRKNAAVVDRLFDAIFDLSGMSKKAAEDAAEDFGPTADDDSSTG